MCWRAGGRTSQVPPVGALLTRIVTDAMPAAGSVAGSTPGRASACGTHGKGCALLAVVPRAVHSAAALCGSARQRLRVFLRHPV